VKILYFNYKKNNWEMKSEKVSIGKCKMILQKDGSVYTDEEVSQIRDYLYMLAEIEHEVFLKTLKKKVEAKKITLEII